MFAEGLSVLGDGAEWIWNLAERHFAAAAQVLDVYHGGEWLAKAGRAAFGEGPGLQSWLDGARTRMIGDGYWGVCERFGTDFTEDDKVFIKHLEAKLAGDTALEVSVKVNPPENARLTFDHVANDKIQEMIDTNFKFYKQINDDAAFERFFLDWLFERYCDKAQFSAP